ncbi:CocE/NonD family hydrolase [candidate division KSB1 bacterium]|nr:CocE/NonD family hydrolase [candidate division KSB1 bacterium]
MRKIQTALFGLLFCAAPLFAYIKTTHMVAMRDQIQLATDVYLSETPGSWPTILIRTPYSKELGQDELFGVALLVSQGYAVVVQDMRGRFASQGVDSLFLDDGWGPRQDGYDTVEWIAAQSWCNGKVGTWGASALGIAQYLLAGSTPPHLVCQFVEVAATNLYTQAAFPGGALLQNLVEGWIAGQGTTYLLPFIFSNTNYNATWERLNLESRFHLVNVPIYHWGGWHDIFTEGALNGFTGLQHNGAIGARGNQKLLIGPWTHGAWGERKQGELTFPVNSTRLDLTEILRWFNYWLQGADDGIMNEPAVSYYVMGAIENDAPGNEWRTANDWPVPAQATSFYFHSDGILSTLAPSSASAALSYVYDPKQPVATIGGRNLLMAAGPYDQRNAENRSDVLLFTTPVLEQSLEVIGKIKAKLWVSSSAIDTDFMAKLTDVYPDGRSMLVCDGAIRMRHRNSLAREEFLTPGEIYECEIDLWTTAMNFNAGHRVRVAISSSNAPRFDPNPNTGGPLRGDSTIVVATNAIYVDALRPSQIILPVTNGSASVNASAHDDNLPTEFLLGASYPNPMRDATQIAYTLSRTAVVRLAIYNTLGQKVRTLVNGLVPRGTHYIKWNGRDELGRQVAKGIYFYRLEVGHAVHAQKLVVF